MPAHCPLRGALCNDTGCSRYTAFAQCRSEARSATHGNRAECAERPSPSRRPRGRGAADVFAGVSNRSAHRHSRPAGTPHEGMVHGAPVSGHTRRRPRVPGLADTDLQLLRPARSPVSEPAAPRAQRLPPVAPSQRSRTPGYHTAAHEARPPQSPAPQHLCAPSRAGSYLSLSSSGQVPMALRPRAPPLHGRWRATDSWARQLPPPPAAASGRRITSGQLFSRLLACSPPPPFRTQKTLGCERASRPQAAILARKPMLAGP